MISATESAPKGCARRAAAVSGFLAVARMYVPHRMCCESRRTQQVPASCRTPLKRQSSAHKLKGDTVISHFYIYWITARTIVTNLVTLTQEGGSRHAIRERGGRSRFNDWRVPTV